jgi:hypothetical protein
MLFEFCSPCPDGKLGLLMRLAVDGAAEQQSAFFSLLITLLKLSAVPRYSNVGGTCRVSVTAAGVDMLLSVAKRSTEVAAAGSSSSSKQACSSDDTMLAALWLLLLGRCCLQWAAELSQMQAAGTDWGQLISVAQHLAVQQPGSSAATGVLAGHLLQPSAGTTLPFCFEGRQPLLLVMAQSVEAALREGSSVNAGLTAAGYDMGAVLQGFETKKGYDMGVVLSPCCAGSTGAWSCCCWRCCWADQGIGGCWQGLQCVCFAALLQQPRLQQCARGFGVVDRTKQDLHLRCMQGCTVLWQGMSEGTLEAAQASLQDAAAW